MKGKFVKRVCGFILMGAMAVTIVPSHVLEAQDIQEESVSSDQNVYEDADVESMQNEAGEDAIEKNIDSEIDIQNGQENEVGNGSEDNEEFKENSWRYSNGELIVPYSSSARASSNAWKKVNGQYYNDRGEVIPGVRRRGVDVSEHQGKIDWAKAKADGVEYAIIRVGWSGNQSRYEDAWFRYNVSECERLGIPYGVYLYSYITTTNGASGAADFVLNLLRGHNLSYPVYLDLEDDDVINSDNASIAQVFLNKISNAGYRVGVYANLNWWNNYLTSPVFNNSSWSKWVAQYYHSCSYTGVYDMWQCTSSGSVNGISGPVDLNMDFRIGEAGPSLVVKEDGTYCYLDGQQLFGEQRVNGQWYYFDEKNGGRMKTGWHSFDSKKVYYGANGAMRYGEQYIEGKWYYFDSVTGAMQSNCFYRNTVMNKTVYYGSDGAMQYGEQLIEGKWYYFDPVTGAMKSDCFFDNIEKNKTVYYGADGSMQYGEQYIKEKWYYFDPLTGKMLINSFYEHADKNKVVYYGTDGTMQYGEQEIDGKKYYFDPVTGAMATGIVTLGNGQKVYYNIDGSQGYGEQRVDGKWYYFDENDGGRMHIGWYSFDNKRVYYGPDGAMWYGEKYIDRKWYYFDPITGGVLESDFHKHADKNKVVYYGADGAMQYGEQEIGGKKYYFDPVTGAMQINSFFEDVDRNITVYYGADGTMQYGEQYIGGKWYYFDLKTGAMEKNSFYKHKSKDKIVYYGADGTMRYGEQYIEGKWYYFDLITGKMLVNSFYEHTDKNKVVYYGADGTMQYGEQEIDGKKYYFDPITGAMQ